eukprot:gb/GECG01008417.1/.p1 GENE.gb/GECG01008417.1/~~gb/GECG01008417.1/.p1  ORF type:complete len:413 (+),score=28.52 gb/GECG01008417.1/:1-1239(+)
MDDTSSTHHTPTDDHIARGKIVVTVVGCLSVVGATTIIGAFSATSWNTWKASSTSPMEKKIRALIQGYFLQLFWLSVCNAMSGLSYTLSAGIPPVGDMNKVCEVQGVGRGTSEQGCLRVSYSMEWNYPAAYFPLASAFWNLILALELHRFMISHTRDLEGTFARTRYKWYHLLGWVPPAIVVGGIYGTRGVVNEGIWCWINSPRDLHAFPQLAIWVIIIVLYVHMGIDISRNVTPESQQASARIKKLFLALTLYPMAYILIWIALVIHEFGVGNLSNAPSYTDPTMAYIAAATAPAQGFLNSIVYLSTNKRARQLVCKGKMPPSDEYSPAQKALLQEMLKPESEADQYLRDDPTASTNSCNVILSASDVYEQNNSREFSNDHEEREDSQRLSMGDLQSFYQRASAETDGTAL